MLCNPVLSHHKVKNRVKIFQSALQPRVEPPLNEKSCKNHLHSVQQTIFELHLSGISCQNLLS